MRTWVLIVLAVVGVLLLLPPVLSLYSAWWHLTGPTALISVD
jgi:hypothetical protein